MQKLLNHRVYIIAIAIALVLGITFLVRSCIYSKEIQATISPLDVEQGIPVSYADSTKGADKWHWEFGNGDTSSDRRGEYVFPETGKYQIRLTVNGNLEKKFIVNVRSPRKDESLDLIKIDAPKEALQGEYITFRGVGNSKDWRWEFGETGQVDAIEKNAIYKYELPGRYIVQLRTEETKYPVVHQIDIMPQYSDTDTTDVASIIGNDIKEKLQAIVDQKPFNKNYNYIMSTYLCNNPNTLVIVNNDKKNDFYSYCQGLKIIGRKRTIIENVLIDVEETESCINKLIVIQTDLE
ncbi:MAG: PKD domain-containing protein [Bacteroides xylanisolvens]